MGTPCVGSSAKVNGRSDLQEKDLYGGQTIHRHLNPVPALYFFYFFIFFQFLPPKVFHSRRTKNKSLDSSFIQQGMAERRSVNSFCVFCFDRSRRKREGILFLLTFTRIQRSMLVKRERHGVVRTSQVTILFIIPFEESSGKREREKEEEKRTQREKKERRSLSSCGSAAAEAARWTQLTFQTVEAAKRKIQEKRRAGVQGQNPQPQKKREEEKKNGQKSAASLLVYSIYYYLDALIRAREEEEVVARSQK